MPLTSTQRSEICGICADAPAAVTDFVGLNLRRRAASLLAWDLTEQLGGVGGPYDLRTDGIPRHTAFRHLLYGSNGGPDVARYYRAEGLAGYRNSIPSRSSAAATSAPENPAAFVTEAKAEMGTPLFNAARDELVARFRLLGGPGSSTAAGDPFPLFQIRALPTGYGVGGFNTEATLPAADNYHFWLTLATKIEDGADPPEFELKTGAASITTFQPGSEGRLPIIDSAGNSTEAMVDSFAEDPITVVNPHVSAAYELLNPVDMYLRIWR